MMIKKNSGFSLVELMIVILLISMLLGIAVPNIVSWLPDYRLRAAARDLYSSMQRAKLSAVKRNSLCTIVFNQPINGTIYDYAVFEDADQDRCYDAGETILMRAVLQNNYKDVSFDPGFGGGTGLVNIPNNGDGFPSFAFRSNGVREDNAAGVGDVSIYLTNINGKTRNLTVFLAGNMQIN